MASYIPFGNSFVDTYHRFTQFILEYPTKQTAILEPENNTFLEYKVLNSKILSLKYNKYKCSSFVLSTDINSFNESHTDFLHMLLEMFTTVLPGGNGADFIQNIRVTHNIDFIGIIESHPHKGWHFHMLCFYRDNFESKKQFETEQTTVFAKFNDLCKMVQNGNQLFLNCETVKSVGSIIHYLKKDPIQLISTTTELAQMYVHFDRHHIFPRHSAPKFTHAKNHRLPESTIIDYFTKKLQQGCIDYEQALQDPYATNFLANRNLKELFENTRTHFLAKRKFKDSVFEIIDKFIKNTIWYKKCICPINEYLKIQNIQLDVFEHQFLGWLSCNSKKNTMLFFGPADTGKSVFLSSLHANFRFNNRLTTDGIFTFANTVNADCVYHEEPFITPETCETAKLVYEGNPNTTVAVKNRGAQRLNKKIPVLITSNDNVYKYCSGQRAAFDARMHIFKSNFKMSNIVYCDDKENITHVCSPLNIDIKRRAYKQLHGTAGDEDQWEGNRTQVDNEENILHGTDLINTNCDILHKLRKHHWRTYIIYIICKYRPTEYFNYIKDNIDIPLSNIDIDVNNWEAVLGDGDDRFNTIDYTTLLRTLETYCINI